jgi:hypothetical protein
MGPDSDEELKNMARGTGHKNQSLGSVGKRAVSRIREAEADEKRVAFEWPTQWPQQQTRERKGRTRVEMRRGKKVEGKRREPQEKGITDRIGGDKDKVITGKLRPGCGGLDGLVWSAVWTDRNEVEE